MHKIIFENIFTFEFFILSNLVSLVITKCGELFASSFAIMYENVINIFFQIFQLFSSFSINTWNLATGKLSEVGHKVMEDLDSGWQASSGWIESVWMSTSGMKNL